MARAESSVPGNGAGNPDIALSNLRARFDRVKPLIAKEWPQLDPSEIEGTGGDPDALVELVAKKTDQPPAKVRKTLAELNDITKRENLEKRLSDIVQNLETKSKQLMGTVRDDMIPQAEATVKDNIWASILSVLGIGLVIGLVLGMASGRR